MSTLKRDTETGAEIVLIEHLEKHFNETSLRSVISRDLHVPSIVGRRNDTGFILSYILVRWPKAHSCVYEDDVFTIISRDEDGYLCSKRTYRILQKAQPRIIYTTN